MGRWFSPGNPVSSTNKTGRHDKTEILLKVTLNLHEPPPIIDHPIICTTVKYKWLHRFWPSELTKYVCCYYIDLITTYFFL
jgi:hypothetical protein